ncbi:MAG: FHA domain-containing protein [Planctomycetaceae bacterium]
MSVATKRPAQTSSLRIPVLMPLYGADLESFCAQADGTYRCGSGAANEFGLEFAGAEANHCSFIRKAGTFSVNRIDGRVWVNDLPVSGINRLTEGDVISLGPVSYRLKFQDAPLYLPEPDDRPLMSFKSAETVVEQPSTDLTTVSLPIPAGIAAPSGQDTFFQTTLQKELEEHQRLLTLRQQQLAELTQIVRERERGADSRLIAIEERSSQLTAQLNELARGSMSDLPRRNAKLRCDRWKPIDSVKP